MREIRTSGSEGGVGSIPHSYLYKTLPRVTDFSDFLTAYRLPVFVSASPPSDLLL